MKCPVDKLYKLELAPSYRTIDKRSLLEKVEKIFTDKEVLKLVNNFLFIS